MGDYEEYFNLIIELFAGNIESDDTWRLRTHCRTTPGTHHRLMIRFSLITPYAWYVAAVYKSWNYDTLT